MLFVVRCCGRDGTRLASSGSSESGLARHPTPVAEIFRAPIQVSTVPESGILETSPRPVVTPHGMTAPICRGLHHLGGGRDAYRLGRGRIGRRRNGNDRA